MWRVFGVLVVLAIVQSEARDDFSVWRREVGADRGSLWPASSSQPVYPHNKHLVPGGQSRKSAEPVTERDREPLEPQSSWNGGNADIEQVDDSSEQVERDPTGDVDEEEPSRGPETHPALPDFLNLGGLGVFSENDGNNFFASGGFDFGPMGLFGSFMNRRQRWWQGPNVCVERKEIADEKEESDEEDREETIRELSHGTGIIVVNGDASFESCTDMNNMYTCTKRKHSNGKTSAFTVTYKCCRGFRRNPGNARSKGLCEKVDMKPLMEIVENDLEAKKFAAAIRETGLVDDIDKEDVTLFVPSDEAIKEYERKTDNNQVDYDVRLLREPEAQRKKRQIDSIPPKTLVLGHVVSKPYDLNELNNEQILRSDNDNNTIRINIYPKPITNPEDSAELLLGGQQRILTANCAPITRGNMLTTKQGLVHGLDGVLMPAEENIFQMLEAHGEFTILAMALRKTGLHEALMKDVDENGEPTGAYTVFAPTDRTFEKLDAATRMKIVNGDSCTLNILKRHILPHTLCSAAVPHTGHLVTTRDMSGDVLALKQDDEEATDSNDVRAVGKESKKVIRVDDKANIERADIIAKNGVIHIVDAVMLPESARSIELQLKEQNLTKYLELIEAAGLKDYFSSLNNATVFVVSDEVLEKEEFKPQLDELLKNKEKAAEFLRYHVVTREVASCDMKDEEDLPTASQSGDKLRINLYSTMPMFRHTYNRATANCARVLRHDLKSCDSTVHEVDRPLFPPNQTMWEMLESDPQYSNFLKMATGTEIETLLKDNNESYTLLAPTNSAFKKMSNDDLTELIEDKDQATEVLKMHVLPEVMCCSGVGHNVWPFVESVRSLSRPLNINRDPNTDEVYFGTTTVAKCDNVATNGVVHRVDKIMLPQRTQMRPFFRQFMFY